MANFSSLKQAIQNYIKENGNKEITGNLLQEILLSMVVTMGDNAINSLTTVVNELNTILHSVDAEPTKNSVNLVRSGGVWSGINREALRAFNAETFEARFNSSNNHVEFFNQSGDILYWYDASAFVTTGLVEDVYIENDNLVFVINTSVGEKTIEVPLTDVFNPNNYYTKTQIDGIVRAIRELYDGAEYRGFITPSSQAESKQGVKMVCFATEAGTYTNFLANYDTPIVIPVRGIWVFERGVDADDWTAYSLLEIDKVYAPAQASGMGRVVLQKNMVNGVNTLTQDMFYKGEVGSRVPNTNTIFVIEYDFTLGSDITIPDNCVLEFDGGSISAGSGENMDTITGNNTAIQAGLAKIFGTDIALAGSWNVAEAYPEWFGAKGDGVTDDTTSLQKCINSFVTSNIILTKAYGVSSIYLEDTSVKLFGAGRAAKLIGIQANTSIIHMSGVSSNNYIANFRIETQEENVIGIYSDGLPHKWTTAGMWYSTIENIVFNKCYSAIKLRAIDNQNQQTYDTANQYFVVNNIIIHQATVDLDFIGQVGQNSFNNCYFESSNNRIRYIRINTKSSGPSDGTYLYFNNCSFIYSGQNVDALVEFTITQQCQVFFDGCWFENITCALLKNPILVYCAISNSIFINCQIPYVVLGSATGCSIIVERSNRNFSSPKARNNYDDHGLTYVDETGNTTEEEQVSTFIYHKVINETTFATGKVLKIQNAGVIDSYNLIIKHGVNTYNITEITDPDLNHLTYITLGQTIHIHRHKNNYSIFTEKPLMGTTTDRTDVIDTTKIYNGFPFYDTTLHKQLYWNGSAWVDATGTPV